MYIVKEREVLANKAIEPTLFEGLTRADRNRLSVETYRKNTALITALLNVDNSTSHRDTFVVDSFLSDSLIGESEDEEGYEDEVAEMVHRLDILGLPDSLQEDILSDDDSIVANALEEAREYLADSFLDDFTPLEVGDSLYLADWLTVKGECKGNESRQRDDGTKLPCHDGTAKIGKKKVKVKTFRPNDLGDGYVKSKGKDGHKTRGHSSSTRVRGENAKWGGAIDKATKVYSKNKKKEKDSKDDDAGFSDSFLDILADSSLSMADDYFADSANPDKRQCNCGKTDSKHTCKLHRDPKTDKKTCVKAVKEKYEGLINKKLSRKKKGKKLSASAILKRIRTMERRKRQGMYDDDGSLKK